jgi:hypothetical protein
MNSNVVTSGFQHAGIFKNQHSLFRPLGIPYDPEEILTIGSFSQARFMDAYPDSSVILSGSPKSIIKPNGNQKTINSFSVLIIPEGMEYEVNFMLDFTLNCLKRFKNVTFIFRLHPLMMNIPALVQKISAIKENNFIFSDNTIDEDLISANFVIYRGSSAVIDALHCGVVPIFLKNLNDKSELDPLYMLQNMECTFPKDLDFLLHINQSSWLKILENSDHIFRKANSLKATCSESFKPI